MIDIDSWREIGATLSRNKTRTFLTAFGIFWGTAMLALLWGGSKGLQGLMKSNFDGFATNCAIIYPLRTTLPYKGYQKGMSWSMNQKDVENIRRIVPELEIVSPIINKSTTIKYRDKTFSSNLQGLEPNYMDVLNPLIISGRFINEADLAKSAKVCVLGEEAANNLFGAEDPIGKYVECNNIYYHVVGITRQRNEINIGGKLSQAIVIPTSTARQAYNLGNNIHFMTLVAKDEYSLSQLKPKIYRALRIEHPLHPDDENNMEFMDISDMFDQANDLFKGLDILLLFVGLSSLIAGIIGVGNIMWIIVKERTKEFGIRRAIGAKPRMIMIQIMQESAILTAIAGTSGICFAVFVLAIASKIISQIAEVTPEQANFQISFLSAILIMILFLVLGGAAGSIPAFKAMKIKPIEALNDK